MIYFTMISQMSNSCDQQLVANVKSIPRGEGFMCKKDKRSSHSKITFENRVFRYGKNGFLKAVIVQEQL